MEGVPFQRDDYDESFRSSMPYTPEGSPHTQQPRVSRQQQERVPYLESPAPMDKIIDMSPGGQRCSRHQRKRLSFHLLYDGNEDNLARPDDENRRVEQELQDSMGDENNQNNNHNNNSNNPLHSHDNGGSSGADHSSNHKEDEIIETENGSSTNLGVGHSMETGATSLPNDSNHCDKNGPIGSSEKQTTTSGTQEAKQNGTIPKGSDISRVAARVVKGDTEGSNRTKSSMSESIDASATSTTSNGSRQYGRTSRSNSITSDYSASPGVGVAGGNRIRAAILPPLRISKDKRNKWLDHLNSFQESNHDVDLQMQEFIKVPGAVEKNLTSGFLICVDSFLYVCTILLIRFAWSCVLLSLHYFFKWTKKPAGKFQFHRR